MIKLLKIPAFKFLAGIIIGVFISLSLVLLVIPIIGSDNIYSQIEKYQTILSLAIKDYFEEVDIVKLNEAGIKGMLSGLDPHSTYISAKDMKKVNESMTGSFEGIGIQYNIINDTIVIEGVIPDGPSEKVGIQPRDRIIAADSNSLVGIPEDSVPKILKGPKGTVVNLSIHRPGNKGLLAFRIVRDKIPLNSISASFVIEGTDIGYIKIEQYVGTTHRELVDSSKRLREQGMKRLILDLRNNGGGMLDQAYKVCDEFLASDTIVYTKGRRISENKEFVARPGPTLEDIPLIVLINMWSASASEITAGAMQDLDRGLVVGTTSFGKGLVQSQMPLKDGSALRLTTARFYTASGRFIQRPYIDKEAWKRLTDRLELEEGSNLEHTLDKIRKEEEAKDKKDSKKKKLKDDKTIDMDSIEIYYTRSGRPVLGGGGITPDYVIKNDTTKLTDFATKLSFQGVFIEAKEKFISETQKKYGDDFTRFNKEFVFTKDMLKELKRLANERDIEWNDEQYETDKEWIENIIMKQWIARSVWDSNTAYQISIQKDRQVTKAMELFPLAEKIFNSSKNKKN